jgi:hypothetical protein
LLDIPGLWDGMRISTLHKMIGMKCDEVGLVSDMTFPCSRRRPGNSTLSRTH